MSKPARVKKCAVRSKFPGPTVRINHDLLLDDFNKLRVIASIKNESVAHLLVRMAEEWHAKKQMIVITLPITVVNDAYYIARHLGFESHEHWIEQSITESVVAASRQFRDSGINLRRLLMTNNKEMENA